MRALVLTRYKQLELADLEPPKMGPRDVLIRVKACGICGSDVHGYDGSSGRRIPPLVMGHEAAGIVEQTGAEVTRFRPGDPITFDSTVYCGQCFFCQRGEHNLCDRREIVGVSTGEFRRHGAFAELVSVPELICYPLPAGLPFEHAALIEAVSVAVHAVNLVPIPLNTTAAVVGAGMIGLLVIQAAKLAGAGTIIAIDLEDYRLELARQLGADHVVNSQREQPADRVRELAGGRGADIAYEVVGSTAPLESAIGCVRKGGTVTLVGNIAPRVELPLQAVVTRQLMLQGSCASNGEYPASIDLISRRAIRVDPILSAAVPLSDGPAWFAKLYAREPNLMKVVLQP